MRSLRLTFIGVVAAISIFLCGYFTATLVHSRSSAESSHHSHSTSLLGSSQGGSAAPVPALGSPGTGDAAGPATTATTTATTTTATTTTTTTTTPSAGKSVGANPGLRTEASKPETPPKPAEPKVRPPLEGPPPKEPFFVDTRIPAVLESDLEGTAIVTMATGDEAGRNAVALVRSLRDVGTRIPRIVVLLFTGSIGSEDCLRENKKHCEREGREPEDIISVAYVNALRKMGAELRVQPPIPRTEFSKTIPGGEQVAWGQAFNKLRVFQLTEFRKVLFLDADILVLQNLDHLVLRPEFTAAMTNDCCNGNAPGKVSGGFWVIEPSTKTFDRIMDMSTRPMPNGGEWRAGDMEVVLQLFGHPTVEARNDWWPVVQDSFQGRPWGLELFDKDYLKPHPRNVINKEAPLPGFTAEAQKWMEAHPGEAVWHSLDVRYDGLVGQCNCLPQRDLGLPRDAAAELGLWPWTHVPESIPRRSTTSLPTKLSQSASWGPKVTPVGYDGGFMSVHFSCIPVGVSKPGFYRDEGTLAEEYSKQPPCFRRYAALWLSKFKRGLEMDGVWGKEATELIELE